MKKCYCCPREIEENEDFKIVVKYEKEKVEVCKDCALKYGMGNFRKQKN